MEDCSDTLGDAWYSTTSIAPKIELSDDFAGPTQLDKTRNTYSPGNVAGFAGSGHCVQRTTDLVRREPRLVREGWLVRSRGPEDPNNRQRPDGVEIEHLSTPCRVHAHLSDS